MDLILFGIMVAGLFFFLIAYLIQKTTPSQGRRLFSSNSAAIEVNKRRHNIISEQFSKRLNSIMGFAKDPVKANELKKKLMLAGCYGSRAFSRFLFFKLTSPLAAIIIGIPLSLNLNVGLIMKPVFLYLLLAFGFYLPNLVLNHKISARQKKISEGLPDALDLLVVCVEAGLGLNAAMKRVADDLKMNNPVLSLEFNMLNLEILAGLDREQALRNLAERTGVEELSTLCAILIQADRFGTSIAQALRVQSDTMRTNRRQRLEELAARTPVKLVFPLILFIFPALVVVILGPAVIQVAESMAKK